jgi:two-component system, chemotaxis family, protein-glutamate methylesterase/glutaminase
MKKVLIVDDSAFVRKLLRDLIGSSDELIVVDTASNGIDALAKIERLHPDVVTLDVEMPKMNGLETLARIMEVRPTPVVMLSSLTTKDAEVSMAALGLGAVDVVAKPIAHGLPQLQEIADELLSTVISAASVDVRKLSRRSGDWVMPAKPRASRRPTGLLPVVIIASSTGGPRALRYLIPRLQTDRSAFYMIIQHLPVGFTATLARDLDTLTPLKVREAEPGDSPQPDTMLIAPAGKHSAFDRTGTLSLTDDPPLWGVRPAADVTMASAGNTFRSRAIGVVLTGMGRDGAHGLEIIRANGGRTLAEHESSCIIYGMPRVAIESGAAQKAVPLDHMSRAIASALEDTSSRSAA